MASSEVFKASNSSARRHPLAQFESFHFASKKPWSMTALGSPAILALQPPRHAGIDQPFLNRRDLGVTKLVNSDQSRWAKDCFKRIGSPPNHVPPSFWECCFASRGYLRNLARNRPHEWEGETRRQVRHPEPIHSRALADQGGARLALRSFEGWLLVRP